MYKEILIDLITKREDYLKLKYKFSQTPLEKSIDYIINQIYMEIEKIIQLTMI
ncbi:MAG: hypothetical protein WBH31_17610 [Promethearchaeia archaeon]